MTLVVSTRDLAEALGLDEAGVETLIDEGAVKAVRTASGERRIVAAEALRYVRREGAAVLRPDLLGFAEAGEVDAAALDGGELLFTALYDGDPVRTRGILQHLFLAGHGVAAIVDGPLRGAMSRIGELWEDAPEGVFIEHRATELCTQALHQLRLALPPTSRGPVAVGGAPEGDPYVLASLAAATVLAAEGFDAVNLGPETPFSSLGRAVEWLSPRFVWISVSAAAEPERLAYQVGRFAVWCHERSVPVLVGGRSHEALVGAHRPGLFAGGSMADLVTLASLRSGGSAGQE